MNGLTTMDNHVEIETPLEDRYQIHVTDTESTLDEQVNSDRPATDTETETVLRPMRSFVAIWDPANDVLFLSRPTSDQCSFLRANPDAYIPESVSEFHSLCVPSLPPSSRSSLCCQFLLSEHDEPLFAPLTPEQRSLRGMTQTSSTLGGLDVYIKGQALSYTHRHQPVYSVLDFSNDFQFDAGSLGLGSACSSTEDACFYRRSGLYLNTSIPGPGCNAYDTDTISISWSTIESPTEAELQSMKRPAGSSWKPRPGRRLKKKRPEEPTLSPLKILNNEEAGVTSPPHPNCMTLGRLIGILSSSMKNRKR